MSVYKKLQSARIKLLDTKLKKSGLNKFAGFQYFELEDIVPAIQRICAEEGLCGVVSFTQDLAYLNIYDVDSEGVAVFSSPMSSAALKGVHEIQNLGAVQSYLRRYLWIAAFEICEHDSLDAVAGKETPKPAPKPAPVAAPKPQPKPEPEPEPLAQPEIEAKTFDGAGIAALKVPAAPDRDPAAWLDLVKEASLVALGFAEKQEDVMQLFKLNKTLFDAVKSTDEAFFKELMGEFAKVKKQFEGATNG
jgi:hypothetical protein